MARRRRACWKTGSFAEPVLRCGILATVAKSTVGMVELPQFGTSSEPRRACSAAHETSSDSEDTWLAGPPARKARHAAHPPPLKIVASPDRLRVTCDSRRQGRQRPATKARRP